MRIEYVNDFITTSLSVDALALHATARAVKRAERAEAGIGKARRRWTLLALQLKACRSMDRGEALSIQLEGAEFRLGRSHAPLLQACVTAHVMAALCLEAHINKLAKDELSPVEFDGFERLPLDAKWLMLPRHLGFSSFARGHQPMQGITRVVKRRNALAHYKDHKEPWIPPGIPSYLEKLGLTTDAARESMQAAVAALTTLAKFQGHQPPYWLSVTSTTYFQWELRVGTRSRQAAT